MNRSYALRNKRIYIAGHRGMVGSALCRRLTQEGCTILTNDLDLRNQYDVDAWFAQEKPDAVIIAAARVGGIAANNDYPADFLYDNLMIESNVIHSAYKAGVEKLLFLGSSCIYPRDAVQPLNEDALLSAPLEPTNEWYAVAKIAGIKLCQSYRKQHGCDFISAMPCNLYGPGDRYDAERSHVIPALMMKMHDAKIQGLQGVELWGSGKPLREFLYVDDLADALVFLMKHYSEVQHINVGSGEEVSIEELARMVADVTGFKGRITFDRTRPDGTPRKVMDNSKIKALGWRARTSLEEGLGLAYDDFLGRRGFAYAA